MKNAIKYSIFLTGILMIIAVILIYQKDESHITTGPAQNTNIDSYWTWENPMTYKQTSISSNWRIVETEGMQEAILSLTHKTGRSLIYIINEETVDDMSLSEYAEAMKPSMQEALGIGEFEITQGDNGEEVYRALGAKYFGNNLHGTRIRIWSNEPNNFWRSVAMTDMEFKALEYEAKRLVDKISTSTKY